MNGGHVVRVALPASMQAVVLYVGEDTPIILDDTTPLIDLADYLPHPVQRGLVVARLRAWADAIEAAA